MTRDGEPPRPGGPGLAGIGDPDARAHGDSVRRDDRGRVVRCFRVRLQAERAGRIAQVDPGPRRVDAERGPHEPRAARQAMVGDAVQPPPCRDDAGLGPTGAPATIPGEAIGPHALDAEQRFDGANQHRGRPAGRLGDHVQAVVHPVDKVHVGESRRPRHDPVPGRRREAGMRREVLRTTVRLDFDDARFAPPGRVVADQPRARAALGRPPRAVRPASLDRRRSGRRARVVDLDRVGDEQPEDREEARDQGRLEVVDDLRGLERVPQFAQPEQLIAGPGRCPGSGRTSPG